MVTRSDLETIQLCKKHWETIVTLLEKEGILPDDVWQLDICTIKKRALVIMGFDPKRVQAQCFCCDQVGSDNENGCGDCLLWGDETAENDDPSDEPCLYEPGEYRAFIKAGISGQVNQAIAEAKRIIAKADYEIKWRTFPKYEAEK